jgi:putative oxidoreductase
LERLRFKSLGGSRLTQKREKILIIITIINKYVKLLNIALINTFPENIHMNATVRLTAYLAAVLKPNLSANSLYQIAWTVLRVVAGLVMIHNGLDKLSNIQSFADAYVSVIGLPFPIFFSYCAAYTELIGAPLLALGLLTRPAAAGLFSTMLVAMYHHILVAGFSIPYLELSMLYAACFQLFLVNGGGQYSVDAVLANQLNSFATNSVLNSIANQRDQQVESLKTSYQASEKEGVSATK